MLDPATVRAPEFAKVTAWLNSEPLTMAGLRGKVVLIDFWTYSCINCIRTQPYLNAWYDKYKDDGLVIVGVHAPEFEFEKRVDNIERAVKDEKILYPVAVDNDYGTWNAFSNHYWPAKYLIDKEGKIRFTHFGEGAYDEMEENIQLLLGKTGRTVQVANGMTAAPGQTPETYLGYERGRNFENQSEFHADQAVEYTAMPKVDHGSWSLGGKWMIGPESSISEADGVILRINFSAKEVYLVMDGPTGATASLKVNGKAATPFSNGGADVAAGGRVHLDGARLYKLIKMPVFTQNATLELTFSKGVSVNAFTFGG